jgi:hypothetical protein
LYGYVGDLFASTEVSIGDLLQLVTVAGAILAGLWAVGKVALASMARLHAWLGDQIETFVIQRRVLALWKPT